MTASALSIAAPAFTAPAFRDALGRFATGVAFVTAAPDGRPEGLVVNSLASVSLRPPLISFCPSRASRTWTAMRQAPRVGVNVLARSHEAFVVGATPPGADRFADVAWRPGPGGVPVVTDALAALTCRVVAEHPAGDHWIVVGEVENIVLGPSSDPLVFFRSAFGSFDAPVEPPMLRAAS